MTHRLHLSESWRRRKSSNEASVRIGICVLALVLSGCSVAMSSATRDLSAGLSRAILDNEDLEGVRDGAPAFLVLLDGLLVNSPNDANLLFTAAELNGAYATAFVTDAARQKLLADKALAYAERGACSKLEELCNARSQPIDVFKGHVAQLARADLGAAYALASAWAGSIQAHADDWNSIAELGRVRLLIERVVVLDEGHARGGAQLYLGVLDTLLPPGMGGRPEDGRRRFERAIELSNGDNQLAKVVYARQYARLVFDRELHDRLLQEVLAADPRVPGFTLQNLVAHEQAKALLDSADGYF